MEQHITQVTVTLDDGTTYAWDAGPDSLTLRDMDASPTGDGGLFMGGCYDQAGLILRPVTHRTVSRSAESGRFTTAEDAAANPETTVTEQVDG